MPQVYEIDGIVPAVHPSAFVHESAVLIGDVLVGAPEPGRKRLEIPGSIPLSELKAKAK